MAVLSSELYMDQLKAKGLISSDWRKNQNRGAVIKSVIVFVTRKGNPKGLVALLQRSHKMADRIAPDDTVRVAALRGSILPDPLGGKEPEYYL